MAAIYQAGAQEKTACANIRSKYIERVRNAVCFDIVLSAHVK